MKQLNDLGLSPSKDVGYNQPAPIIQTLYIQSLKACILHLEWFEWMDGSNPVCINGWDYCGRRSSDLNWQTGWYSSQIWWFVKLEVLRFLSFLSLSLYIYSNVYMLYIYRHIYIYMYIDMPIWYRYVQTYEHIVFICTLINSIDVNMLAAPGPWVGCGEPTGTWIRGVSGDACLYPGAALFVIYHLVIWHSHGKSLINGGFNGKSSINGLFSMATLNNQMVAYFHHSPGYDWVLQGAIHFHHWMTLLVDQGGWDFFDARM